MDPILQNTLPHAPGCITVISTDTRESEALIRQLADDMARQHPQRFAGKSPCVYFRLRYAAPYEPFEELRQLILRVRDATGLRAHYRGIVALEASEWLGHEQEEYFTVVLKYLYDHSCWWQPVMLLSDGAQHRVRRFLAACAAYMTPRLVRMPVFADAAQLENMVQEAAVREGITLHREAGKTLARALMSPRLAAGRNGHLIRRVVQQLSDSIGPDGEITLTQVEMYLRDPDALPVLLAGGILTDRGSQDHGKDQLQL